jgi:hypothetical protein
MGAILEIVMQVLAGMGIMSVADKVLPDKVPNYQPVSSPIGFNIKTIVTVISLAIGAFLVIFLGRKFKIFKTRR